MFTLPNYGKRMSQPSPEECGKCSTLGADLPYLRAMRMLPLAGLIAVVALLSGCAPADPVVTPQPEPSSAPLFATEEEALAAATEAYAAYSTMFDQLLADGGADPGRLVEVAAGAQLDADTKALDDVRSKGLRGVGTASFDTVALQNYDPWTAESTVVVYLCEDVTGVDVVDPSGLSVVSESRLDRVGYEVSFNRSDETKLLVASKEVWASLKC
jgi:hypothetical protein